MRYHIGKRRRILKWLLVGVVFLSLVTNYNLNKERSENGKHVGKNEESGTRLTSAEDRNTTKRDENRLRESFSGNIIKNFNAFMRSSRPFDLDELTDAGDVPHETLRRPCFASPYFLCDDEPTTPITDRTFNVAYLRRPAWQPSEVFNFSRCRFSKCVYQAENVTRDTDVVLVYGLRLSDSYPLPKRWPHQVYVFADWEPPNRVNASFLTNSSSVWNHAFNLTFTYRLDSDIPAVYFRLKPNPRHAKDGPDYYQIAKRKSRTAVWFVSRCRVPSRRMAFVKEMKKYTDVDIYGACGQRCTLRSDDCTDRLAQYKFYLSFENSFCTDYITEKLFKTFADGRHIVPVVRGGGDYDKHFPKGLFVNAADFRTPRELATHLRDLGSDHEKYSKYLERKDAYVIGELTHQREAGCELCKYLQTREPKPKVYDMKRWFGDGHCKKPSEIRWPKS